jgi:hypothetical protein
MRSLRPCVMASVLALLVAAPASARPAPKLTKVWTTAHVLPGTSNVVDQFKLWIRVRGSLRGRYVYICTYGLHDTLITARSETKNLYLIFGQEECYGAFGTKQANTFYAIWRPAEVYESLYQPLLLGANVPYRIELTANPQPNPKPSGSVTLAVS